MARLDVLFLDIGGSMSPIRSHLAMPGRDWLHIQATFLWAWSLFMPWACLWRVERECRVATLYLHLW